MRYKIKFEPENKEVEIKNDETILEAALKNGIHINAQCQGKGVCGKCKIILKEGILNEKERVLDLLTREERDNNYYIACLTYPESDLVVEVPKEARLSDHQIISSEVKIEKKDKVKKFAGVAVDIGTTTVSAYLIDLKTGEIVESASVFNKQITYGADVLSRIEYSKKEHGLERLNKAIVETINELIEKLFIPGNFESGNADLKFLGKMVVSGNTTMTYFLIKRNPEEIQKNIQIDAFKQSYYLKANKLGINSGRTTDLYIAPGIGSYVGGDIIADIIAAGIHKSEDTCLIIDVGTNGEIALGNKDWLMVSSTSAGPAFEGTSTKCGMRATAGAIDKVEIHRAETCATGIEPRSSFGDCDSSLHDFQIQKRGEVYEEFNVNYRVLNNTKPRGICGSGFIHLIPGLFLNDIIDYKGKFNKSVIEKSERIKIRTAKIIDDLGNETCDDIPEFIIAYGNETSTGEDITITEKDIENIIMTKAAIYAGVSTMTKVGVSLDEISKVYIAGGFGYYLNIEKSIILGLLPDIDKDKFEFIGNGSLKGASMILNSDEKKKEAEEIAKNATYFDFSTDALGEFTGEYMKAMFVPHQDPDRFPSVEH